MSAQTVVELYRTAEDKVNKTFCSCITISYFDDIAFVQGLSGTFTTKCYKEILDYLEKKGCTKVQYLRKGRLKIILI